MNINIHISNTNTNNITYTLNKSICNSLSIHTHTYLKDKHLNYTFDNFMSHVVHDNVVRRTVSTRYNAKKKGEDV